MRSIGKRWAGKYLPVLVVMSFLSAAKVAGAPVETSHWNSNTFENLNTLTDKTTITFSVSYNGTGDITWYKDGVEAGTFSSTNTAQYTTSWSETGMKEVKAEMFNGAETSTQTVWSVEVQEAGTATLTTLDNYLTFNIAGGWTNIPSLYLKKKNNDWIEYVSSGTYIVKTTINVQKDGVLKADGISSRVIKLRGVAAADSNVAIISALDGGTILMDSMTITGWDTNQDVEISSSVLSPKIRSFDGGTLRITNSFTRHILIDFRHDFSSGDLLDNNYFYKGNPCILDLSDSRYQVITRNVFFEGYGYNLSSWNSLSTYTDIEYNRFIGSTEGHFGDNAVIGGGSKIIGNEFTLADWNLAEIHVDSFCRDNDIHDNGGIHNGFNGLQKNVYSYNDYAHDFTTNYYSGFYCQVVDPPDDRIYPAPLDRYPDHVYFINSRAKRVRCGFNIFGGFNFYLYNCTCDQSGVNVQYAARNIFFRKCSFNGLLVNEGGDSSFRVVDTSPEKYRYVEEVTMMDCVFTDTTTRNVSFQPLGGGVVNVINACRKMPDGSVALPTHRLVWGGNTDPYTPELRFYVWLDALVKDQNGRLVKDANITVECLTAETSTSSLKVTLPPPPPDLWDMPAEPLPQPALANFTRLKTLSTGKLPGPNYGWSATPEPCAALLMQKLSVDRTSGSPKTMTTNGYQYSIKASYHGLEASTTVTPGATWLCEIPTAPVITVELVLNGDSTTGIDTVPPVLSITAPVHNRPVYGTTVIEAMASDNWDIDRMEIFVDNVSRAVIAADSCAWTADGYICSWNWNAAQESDGTHTIKVVAYDTSGNATSKTVTVQILTETMKTSNKAIVYPNPYIKGRSAGSTCIFTNLPADATVRIYTISGDPVATIAAEATGEKGSAAWDVSRVSGGIYLYSVHSSKDVQKGKIGIVK